MSTKKALGGSFGAIACLLIAQIIAQLLGSLLVIIKVPEGLCNIAAGVIYLCSTYILLKVFAQRILKINMEELGITGFHINIKWVIVSLALPLIVLGIYLLFPGSFVSSGMNGTKIFSTLGAGIVYTGIAAGFVEEMVFRGFILNLLKTRWNVKIAVIVPSVLFGILHIIGMNFSILSCVLVLIAGTMVGVMFSLIELDHNSVWNSGIVHALWNVIIIGGGLAVGETVDQYSIVTYVLKTKSFAITGGEFGIESSIIAVMGYIIVAIFALFVLRRKRK